MKKITFILLFALAFHFSKAQVTLSPNAFEVDQSITITVDINSNASDCNGLTNPSKVYMHSGIGDNSDAFGFKVVGNWGQDDGVGEMQNQGGGIWSITITPKTYFGLTDTQSINATQLGMVFRSPDGNQELKASGCKDFVFAVGIVIINIVEPTSNPIFIEAGENLTVKTNLSFQGSIEPGEFTYFLDGVEKASGMGFPNAQGIINNITQNGTLKVVGSPLSGSDIGEATRAIIIVPPTIEEALPNGLAEGINYNTSDATKATLVLNAPGKEYVQLAGSFNNYNPSNSDFMKKDTGSDKFWIELTGLTPSQIYTYQYWVYDKNPIAGSPALVKTADPYSTLVLSPFDDPGIPSSTYPNLPTYPAGQEREVTVLQTNKPQYNWQVTNFNRPKKEDLVIYEVLIRDFDANRNYQNIIDRIDYFKNLNINAIQLMPVMEFEGNESWGYNTSFHMALDKFYGTEDKFKELIDTCHQNGIAVILDIALNHAFGRNPMVRMWMNDPDGDGWGEPSAENPYFNETPRHAYNVGSDFNHSSDVTQAYTKRVVKHWIEVFNIDGFRWDLTKGFTQNCTDGDETCTNNFQQDRVDVLKEYADYSWSLDATHYVIFEHLGSDNEEKEWANYRINEGKGVMMWSEEWGAFKNLGQGQNNTINIDRMGHKAHTGFTGKRVIGYPESHDKDRIMYEMTQFGVDTNPSHNVKELNIALKRMSAIGAVSLPIPGPKMIWHFAALGMNNSIFTCSDGSVNTDYDAIPGDCKLDTKPQPQWTENWLSNTNRNQIYKDWARLNALKINEPVFEGDYNITSGTQTPRISIFTGNENSQGTDLKNVVIIANFAVTAQNVNPNFPYGGSWYDLMDESNSTLIDGNTNTINLGPGEFKIYGNKGVTLSNSSPEFIPSFQIFPNPSRGTFSLNADVNHVEIYNITGKVIKIFKGTFSKNFVFDVTNLPQSIYLIKAKNNNGQVNTVKLVKL
ncbi:T9SS type A sorting domain-containing protein [Tamlana fucoidanivorans]|uniref:T9SS type A sorting domain-containing protein n=1 Tax=Allotamlana fucoidanivorans TaxID=2583814 RepID=A0A5C4SMJ9_9FLAO|nr:alpha-amylase family glycosyl hydrolase [Tamlana fucoidanivorans]TNJ45215.1 T9SS type A sorting domain-containing protein [Tamlana fucoidanivorans]